MRKQLLSLSASWLIFQFGYAQAPVIQSVTPVSATVEKWEKFEAKVALSAAYSNPYNYDEIRVFAIFTAPDGSQKTVDGFYQEGYNLNLNTGALQANPAENGFRIRFAPDQPGAWSYSVSCTTAGGTAVASSQAFECIPASSGKNHGFVQATQTNYLRFQDGKPYVPVGENMAWQDIDPFQDYSIWVNKLASHGGNYFRFWLCHWGLGLEWKQGINEFSGLLKYKQSSARYMDWLFDLCAQRGVYVMFCLNHHGQVSSQVNPNWSENPYNMTNGGMCANTWDFFTNADAQKTHKNRLRYILARWGYQRSIMCWELFNEVNWTDNFEQHQTEIAAWHETMAAFLKLHDPAKRPVSTSFGAPQSEMPAIWNDMDIDFTQRHYYLDNPNLETVLANAERENINAYDKPVLVAEFGLTTGGQGLNTLDPVGIHIHNNLWGGLFGGGLGTAMTWWWDSYVEPSELYYHFNGISTMMDQIDLQAGDFHPMASQVSGAPHDLRLNASLGWAEQGDTLIQVSNTGVITPSNYKLGSFMYGSVWNTQYRRPAKFQVNMPAPTLFSVLSGNMIATSPKISIWLDGQIVLNVNANTNTVYSVTIPAGQHIVKVDNNGTDWMQITSYTFQGLGSAVESYALKAAAGDKAAGWLLNTDYNHAYVNANGIPNFIHGAHLQLDGLNNGQYLLKWFTCSSGLPNDIGHVAVQNGHLDVEVPNLYWDYAFSLEKTSSSDTREVVHRLPFQAYPNPLVSGNDLQINLEATTTPVQILMLDAAGKEIKQLYNGNVSAQASALSLNPGNDLPAGIYWLVVKAGGDEGMQPISVIRP